MNWRAAFLKQARCEHRFRLRLNEPSIETCHRLHYLQMVTEKLAKGFLTNADDKNPPVPTHNALVRLLQSLKSRPDIRRDLGFQDTSAFKAYINSLLELAARVERLAPSATGFSHPNPEYPWRDIASGEIVAPADFEFELFDPHDPKMIKLERLIDWLVRNVQ